MRSDDCLLLSIRPARRGQRNIVHFVCDITRGPSWMQYMLTGVFVCMSFCGVQAGTVCRVRIDFEPCVLADNGFENTLRVVATLTARGNPAVILSVQSSNVFLISTLYAPEGNSLTLELHKAGLQQMPGAKLPVDSKKNPIPFVPANAPWLAPVVVVNSRGELTPTRLGLATRAQEIAYLTGATQVAADPDTQSDDESPLPLPALPALPTLSALSHPVEPEFMPSSPAPESAPLPESSGCPIDATETESDDSPSTPLDNEDVDASNEDTATLLYEADVDESRVTDDSHDSKTLLYDSDDDGKPVPIVAEEYTVDDIAPPSPSLPINWYCDPDDLLGSVADWSFYKQENAELMVLF
jgi:hypothetical protein